MTAAIKFPAARQAATEMDERGLETFTRPWFLFFQQIYERVGGATGASSGDQSASLFEDAGNAETNAMLFSVERSLFQQPLAALQVAVETLTAEVASQRDQIAELQKDLDSVRQGTFI